MCDWLKAQFIFQTTSVQLLSEGLQAIDSKASRYDISLANL